MSTYACLILDEILRLTTAMHIAGQTCQSFVCLKIDRSTLVCFHQGPRFQMRHYVNDLEFCALHWEFVLIIEILPW